MMTLVYFLLAIAILVFVHEMGHFLAARSCGVQVIRFSIGFGKEVLKWTQPKTGTEWVVALVPLGGYVRMEDASFDSKPLAARSWIVFAGPLANLIFAAVAYSFLFSADRQDQIRMMLSESLKGVVSQTLCKKKGGGRIAALEILLSTMAIANAIRERKTHQIPSMMQTSRALGMQTLNDALARLVKDGLITPEEAVDKSHERALLVKELRGAGIAVNYAEEEKK